MHHLVKIFEFKWIVMLLSLERGGVSRQPQGRMCESDLEISTAHQGWLFPPSEPGFAGLLHQGLSKCTGRTNDWGVLLKHRFRFGRKGGTGGCTSNKLPGDAMLLVQGPHFG